MSVVLIKTNIPKLEKINAQSPIAQELKSFFASPIMTKPKKKDL